jgi:hypothetical protein
MLIREMLVCARRCAAIMLFVLFAAVCGAATDCAAAVSSGEELFAAAKLSPVYQKRWDKISEEQRGKVLHYFSMGQEKGLDQEQLTKLGKNLLAYFYYIQGSMDYFANPSGKYTGGISKESIGEDIDNALGIKVFAATGKQFDDKITELLEENIRRAEEEGRQIKEILEILKKIQKSM